MAANAEAKKNESQAQKKKRAFRTEDDLELLRIILDENPLLRQRILRMIQKQVGEQRLAASKPPPKKPK